MFVFSSLLSIRASKLTNSKQCYSISGDCLWNIEEYISISVLFTLNVAFQCLVHTTDTEKTRLSCLVDGVNSIGDKLRLFSVVLNKP